MNSGSIWVGPWRTPPEWQHLGVYVEIEPPPGFKKWRVSERNLLKKKIEEEIVHGVARAVGETLEALKKQRTK